MQHQYSTKYPCPVYTYVHMHIYLDHHQQILCRPRIPAGYTVCRCVEIMTLS